MFLAVIWTSLQAYAYRKRKGDFKVGKSEQEFYQKNSFYFFNASDVQIT